MKRFKTKQNRRTSKLLIILIPFVIFIMIFLYLSSLKLERSYASFINFLYKDLRIIDEKKQNPLKYLLGNLDYLITDYLFIEEEVLVNKIESNPIIYIYNTHNKEEYKENNDYNIKPTIISASYMLKDVLQSYKIDSFVEEKKVSDYLDNRNYSESYQISRTFLEEAILKNNNYEYFIDIHRDSVKKEHTQVMINNKEYARIMFVLGLDNANYLENKRVIEKLNNYINNHYPGLSRGIYEKSGKGVNGIYNQDFHPNTMLIEIGGVDSNLNSVFNSTEIIAEALYSVIGDKIEESY